MYVNFHIAEVSCVGKGFMYACVCVYSTISILMYKSERHESKRPFRHNFLIQKGKFHAYKL